MLENLITKRGGLEGKNKSEYKSYLNQQEFEAFFQQIKPFLTVQEQLDLFLELQKRGSAEAGFLAFLSLTAIGFSRKKPEKLFEARKTLKKLNLQGLDSMPLIGCLDLLLADIDQACGRFLSSSDEKLRDWLNNYPGEKLEAICLFCKNWLENEVLVGYRDIDIKEIDLDSWFEDNEIQEFIEKLEKKSKIIINPKLRVQQNLNKDSQTLTREESDKKPFNLEEMRLPWPGGIKKKKKILLQEISFKQEIFKNKSIELYKYAIEKIAELKFYFGEFLENKESFKDLLFYLFVCFFGFIYFWNSDWIHKK